MTKYTLPTGVFDILPFDPSPKGKWKLSERWQFVESIARDLARDYGFREIRTPIFEKTELFLRSVGETSDIASKEMYTFEDRGGRSMSLRPEGTAPVMRAYAESGLAQYVQTQKLFYIGPMFRYERPQLGRYRQLHQFGVEVIGRASPDQDAEVIEMLVELYRRLGLGGLVVLINSIGDLESRTAYKLALQNYLKPHFDSLSADSQTRFEKNVLRILDSKDPGDREILKGAPSILDCLNEKSAAHFKRVCHLLSTLGIEYRIDQKLVRGLDYYNHTVFEVISEDLGAQSTVGGGGRYDGLLSQIGGADLPTVGWGTGIERILHVLDEQNFVFKNTSTPFVYFIPMGEKASQQALLLATHLRQARVPSDMLFTGGKVATGIKTAIDLEAVYAVVIGDEEIEKKTVELKHLSNRTSLTLSLDAFTETVRDLYLKKEA